MKSLQQLSALAILQSDVNVRQRWFKLYGETMYYSRCACDNYEEYYMNDYKTKDYIWLLPLPVPLKEFVSDVAEKYCEEDHPESEEDEECFEGSGGLIYSHGTKCQCFDYYSSGSIDVQDPRELTDTDQSIDEAEDESDKEDRNANVDLKTDADQDGDTTVMSLQESCAKTILRLRLNQFQWPGPSGAVINGWSVTRCTCYTCAETFISRLPLPEAVKEFIAKVSKKQDGVK